MKKLLLLFQQLLCFVFLFFTVNTFAQNVSTEYADRVDYIFANLEENRIPYGILVDQSVDFIELSHFKGQSITNENWVDLYRYRDIYYTLATGRMVKKPSLISPTELTTRFNAAREKRTITLMGLYMRYAKFKNNAYSSNLIRITNDQFFDVYKESGPCPPGEICPMPGTEVWQNPYEQHEVFAITPSVPRYKGKAIYVKLPNNLWFSNQSIRKLQIDFDDGKGYQNITFGETKQVLYKNYGKKEWRYKLTLKDKQVRYSHSFIEIEKAPVDFLNKFPQYQPARVVGTCPLGFSNGRQFCEIEADEAFQSQFGRAFVTVDYIGNNTTITKPLIVAEGLDMGHILEPEALFGSSTINGFIGDIRDDNILESELRQILDQNQEYDIIYVDWQNGTDFLERNALVLEAVIDWVNEEKTSNEPNVVLGQSMGGVIARYALRDMENKGLDHDTRLYISFDAPHQGANIPISLLYGYRHLQDFYFSTRLDNWNIDFGLPFLSTDLLALPAPRQLLKNYVTTGFTINNTVFNNWQNKLQNMGYPLLTENVSVSNGSECGITQAFNPADPLFDFHGNIKTSTLSSFLLQNVPIINTVFYVALAYVLDNPAPLIGLLPGSSTKFSADFWGLAQPLNGSQRIYYGRLRITKRIFIVNINANLTYETANADPNILPFDYYAGGQYPMGINLLGFSLDNDVLDNIFDLLIDLNVNLTTQDAFDFIPVPSALDIGGSAIGLNHTDYLRGYSGGIPPSPPLDTPFDAYITAFGDGFNNEFHINILPRNGNFVASHLEDSIPVVFDCSAFCGNSEPIGPDVVCSSADYSIPGFTGTITWSVSPTGIATVNSSGQVTRIGNNNGVVTLSAQFGGDCGSTTISKDIGIGIIDPENVWGYMDNFNDIRAYVDEVFGAIEYRWYLDGTYIQSSTTPYTVLPEPDPCQYPDQIHSLEVEVVNDCGTSNKDYSIVDDERCAYDRISTGVIYPNPANNQLTIDLSRAEVETSQMTKGNHLYKITITNQMGSVVRQLETQNQQTVIDVSDLMPGAYFVIIQNGKEVMRETLIIE